ncbi:hypothetical protein, partial [Desulfosporosinus shakirovi]|uniref:hypothetical protein n=1 Tax=Desulfosporosinus shakirovi TaxID=2885154 RepID=UPI001E5E9A6D
LGLQRVFSPLPDRGPASSVCFSQSIHVSLAFFGVPASEIGYRFYGIEGELNWHNNCIIQ